jgi:hypothetical protein
MLSVSTKPATHRLPAPGVALALALSLTVTLTAALLSLPGQAHALEQPDATTASAPAAKPKLATLLPFNSEEGMALLARATARRDFPALVNQFEPQSNIAFCGPTSAAIVLNALQAGKPDLLPLDRSRLRAEDGRYLPPVVELAVPRHTQESVLGKGRKTRAQALGEPMMLDGKARRDPGFQLRQLDETLRAHGARTRIVIVDDKKADKEILDDLIENLRRPGDYVIVNYRRQDVGQRGGAHLSPLGAYDAESDAFLVMDVNPTSAGWVWMPAGTLIKGMRTFDTLENRGYILVW